MTVLVVLGIALLAVVVGIAIGVRLTSRRYQRALAEPPHDITEELRVLRRSA